MSKSNSELLASFTKANKVRREAIAKKAGFASADAYKAHLQGKPNVAISPVAPLQAGEKPTIHIVSILDASGSMDGAKFKNALAGINGEIRELKTDDTVNYTYTFVSFADDVQTRVLQNPIGVVNTISDSTRGMTALNQAIGQTLEKMRGLVTNGDKVLVKIFTDGGENASGGKYKDREVLAAYIKECEANGYTVTFVGTSIDVTRVQRDLKIASSNTLVHNNTARGVSDSFATSLNATKAYSKKVLNNEDVLTGFYKQTDQTL